MSETPTPWDGEDSGENGEEPEGYDPEAVADDPATHPDPEAVVDELDTDREG